MPEGIKTVEEADTFLKKHASTLKDEDVGMGGAMALPTGGKEEEETIAKRLRSQK